MTASSSPPSAACSTSTKPGPAVGHRREVELVAGGAPPPARGDRLGRLDGGEGAGELVRRHEDPHGAHPRGPGRCGGAGRSSWIVRPMRPEDVRRRRAAERRWLPRASTRRDLPRGPARARSPVPPTAATAWARRTARTCCGPTPAGAGWPRTTSGMVGFATSSVRELTVVPRDVRRAARTSRAAGSACSCSTAALHHGRGCLRGMLRSRTRGRAALPPGRLHPAPADVPDRHRRPLRDPRRREGARGLGRATST